MNFITEHYPGVSSTTADVTDEFILNHSMLRIKDPVASLDFYTRIMGMYVMRRLDFSEMSFSLYFLVKSEKNNPPPEDVGERTEWVFNQKSVLELTHNWGTEDQDDFAYHNGNSKPQGFGHVCFAVQNLKKAVEWFDSNQVEFVKRPEQGKLKDVAFIKDPDGYWVEIVQPSLLSNLGR